MVLGYPGILAKSTAALHPDTCSVVSPEAIEPCTFELLCGQCPHAFENLCVRPNVVDTYISVQLQDALYLWWLQVGV